MYPCEPCGMVFEYKTRIVKHLRTKHKMELGTNTNYPDMWTVEDECN